MTQHGGARKGAGRRPGSVTQRTREVAERASADGIVPIEIMLTIMREQWAVYEKDRTPHNGAIALAAAKDVAPYVHPRLTATDTPIRLPALRGSPTEQSQRILDALATGQLTPDQATRTMQAIALHRRILEADELLARVKALEESLPG